MAPVLVLPPSVLNTTLGVLEAGCMVSCFLVGIVTIQIYGYYSRFPKDPSWIKYMVAFVWLCEIGHSVCITHAVYIITVVSWSNPTVLNRPPKTLSTAIFFSALSTGLVQCFLAWRIKGITNSWIITVVCWVLSLIRTVMALLSFVEGVEMVNLEEYLIQWKWSILATLILASANDLLIALSLTWALLRERRNTMVKRYPYLLVASDRSIDKYGRNPDDDSLFGDAAQLHLVERFYVPRKTLLEFPNGELHLSILQLSVSNPTRDSLQAVLNGRSSLREKQTVVELYSSASTGRFVGATSSDTMGFGSTRVQVSRSIESDHGDIGKRTVATTPETLLDSDIGVKSVLVAE
ncbi:hypothetical protein D9757_009668 [Collybiopsis confluens]|uniref:Uncharacterized protein n=1 Tax=Collybiopsis confluens TaxID=2823264 RepID=A0A8H5H259_9AGAR|nr:hypothetical protein D9757_009668 [Collybiopsis confluens]